MQYLRALTPVLMLVGVTSHAAAQCSQPFTISVLDAFRAIGNPHNGDVQPAGSAWKYHETTDSGLLLSGLENTSILVPGYWGDASQPYTIPVVGPVWSPDPQQNQITYGRTPSFTGVQLHTGFPGYDLFVVFTPQSGVSILGAVFRGEVLGGISDGVLIDAYAKRASGNTTLIAPSYIPYTSSGSSTFTAPGPLFPLALGAGESVVLHVNLSSQPYEDWLNGNLTLQVSGGPVVIVPPRDSGSCQNTPAALSVTAAGSGVLSYQWQRESPTGSGNYNDISDGVTIAGSTISGAQSPSLSVSHPAPADGGRYRVRVSSGCGTVTTPPATLTVCISDFDCSGFVDFDDFNAFISAFEAGTDNADVDGTGFVDFDDFNFYVQYFESGC